MPWFRVRVKVEAEVLVEAEDEEAAEALASTKPVAWDCRQKRPTCECLMGTIRADAQVTARSAMEVRSHSSKETP